ncbi:hypothetical protein LUZ63_008058 [Rhynchospora breviuscula]|uniref:Defective in cullin neddylation protein n=1 Tax=Rhynchospora breviuscula TaxID=2022672 RepID=A0A9Q0CSV0_9POAL|nr:hypothetical protein LUZ63_008058 [Rhynchospora breviuscula]
MECLRSNCSDIFDVFYKYCDIISGSNPSNVKEFLSLLLKSVDERRRARDTTLGDIVRLMPCLNLSDDSQFNCFYDFVFFICRENGQKSIAVHRALSAWKIVLQGRFRLLDQWCDFVQKHQKHNISEDTWQQLLAFSRCVREDLGGYDPKGAWPVLIDDFVEHMHRTIEIAGCSENKSMCCSISNTFSGLNLLPGSKRKTLEDDSLEGEMVSDSSEYQQDMMQFKRQKNNLYEDSNRHNIRGCVQTSVCAVEGSLSKGFEGYLSIGSPFQLNHKNRAS